MDTVSDHTQLQCAARHMSFNDGITAEAFGVDLVFRSNNPLPYRRFFVGVVTENLGKKC